MMSMSEDDLGLISAGFTAVLGYHVVPPSRGIGLPKLNTQEVSRVFKCTYVPRSLEGIDPGEVFEINAICINGCQITVQVTNDHTIADIKADVEIKHGIDSNHVRLMFNRNQVEDHQSVRDIGIRRGGRLHFMLKLRGGGPDFQLDIDLLDPPYDYDLTDVEDNGKDYRRGGREYKRPYGWKRFALKVLGKYEDDTWFGTDGIRTQENQGEWPVSYHGTNMQSARAIMASGYMAGPGQKYGKAVYSSPSLDMVEQRYAKIFEHDGSTYKIALQNRVNPSPGHFQVISAEETGTGAEYWLSPKHDTGNNIHDIRAYGLLFKKVSDNSNAVVYNTVPSCNLQ
ncbi:uncharacterized protein LOC110246216 [Exaiptasia diaphana]|uniref:Ubiquitin-like domain-containing protein n=1 Tax=Exaiptasia diaphana TaxID=2652724 RepID=A0A913XQP8_EXADI|nr:uncharacterized protein LOC110246216 [Exaiptasia diaphana]